MLKVGGKMMWMKEGINALNMLNSVPPSHVAKSDSFKMAREMHASTGHVGSCARGERKRN